MDQPHFIDQNRRNSAPTYKCIKRQLLHKINSSSIVFVVCKEMKHVTLVAQISWAAVVGAAWSRGVVIYNRVHTCFAEVYESVSGALYR